MKPIINIIVILALVMSTTALAQGQYDTILQQIERNNTQLAALLKQAEAQKIAAKTNILPENPEVEFDYLWGNPVVNANKVDFSVSQTIDFPSAYVFKNQRADLQIENITYLYKAERMNILLEAKQLCIELTYNNALAKEYALRVEHAEEIAQAYRKRMQNGEANAIEQNKAELNLVAVSQALSQVQLEQQRLHSLLQALNGNQPVEWPTEVFTAAPLAENFDSWYAIASEKNPMLAYVKGEVAVREKAVQVNRAMALPKLSAGYAQETVLAGGEAFKGLAVGLTIPLWENKNSVKLAKAEVSAAQATAHHQKIAWYNQLYSLFQQTQLLNNSINQMQSALVNYSNETLLKKALDSGELNLLNYLLESQYYYNVVEKLYAMQKEHALAEAALFAVAL